MQVGIFEGPSVDERRDLIYSFQRALSMLYKEQILGSNAGDIQTSWETAATAEGEMVESGALAAAGELERSEQIQNLS